MNNPSFKIHHLIFTPSFHKSRIFDECGRLFFRVIIARPNVILHYALNVGYDQRQPLKSDIDGLRKGC